MKYFHNKIEEKWQKKWAKNQIFKAENNSKKPKYYVLDMFPYPSGAGLHVGHPLGYIASDIYARYKRHKGFNVLHPQGYDSFGLPAEQYAIQTGQHPAKTTEENIKTYRRQLDRIGFSFDWSREVRTSNPDFYKHTQWIFTELFNSYYCNIDNKALPILELIKELEKNGNVKVDSPCDDDTPQITADDWKNFSDKEKQEFLLKYRLTYLKETTVNWCPELGTVLANDEVVNGVSERGGHPVVQKKMMQWSMRITVYAQRLLDDLQDIDWPQPIKDIQTNWIGRSEGAMVKFPILSFPEGEKKAGSSRAGYLTGGNNSHLLLDKARNMRANPTEAESILWKELRGKQIAGYKFRQQHLIDDYIVDFVCLKKKLIIEVDGEIHNFQEEKDLKRTKILENLGYKVIRFKNEEVIGDIENVLKKIETELNTRPDIFEEKNKEVLPLGKDLGWGISVFTTRPDTIFGVSFMTLAPEHELVSKITTPKQKEAVEAYVQATAKRTERERMSDVKTVSGVFTGAYAEHPFTKEPIPIYIGDYVLAGYGTGAVMAVPCGDQRDYDFAKHFGLPIPNIFKNVDVSEGAFEDKGNTIIDNSDFLTGLPYKKAFKTVIYELEKRGIGYKKVNYRLRDAIFARQRYWGEPIPVYYDQNGMPQTLSKEHLPLILPEVEKYLPTEDGRPPLANAKKWHWLEYNGKGKIVSKEEFENSSPSGRLGGELELNTMPGWAGSSWYFNRYMDAHNPNEFASKEALDYWQDVDLYIGGSEHATGHLLYSRFWQKFLFDRGFVPKKEYAKKLINQGMILGESAFAYREEGTNKFLSKGLIKDEKVQPIHVDVKLVNTSNELDIEGFKQWREDFKDAEFVLEDGKYIVGREVEKMSKSKYNVVNPDDICEEYGADALRLFEMFLGPLEQSKPWKTAGISGVYNFLKKMWKLYQIDENGKANISDDEPTKEALKTLHKTIKKVDEDIANFSFNTSVSSFMIAVNELTQQKCNNRKILEPLLVLISPYAPHIAEELWEKLGNKTSITYAPFPVFDEKYLKESSKTYPISFNGKMRFTMDLSLDLNKDEIQKAVMEDERTQKQLAGRTPKKVIVVPGKIVNIVG